MTNKVEKILHDRGKTHGDYSEMCNVIQSLKEAARGHLGWERLGLHHRETLDSIFLKVGRIVTGDPDFNDHWDDIAGYATRMSERITAHQAYANEIAGDTAIAGSPEWVGFSAAQEAKRERRRKAAARRNKGRAKK